MWVERFGEGRELYFTIFNDNRKQARTATVTIQLAQVLKGQLRLAELLLPERRVVRLDGGKLTLTLQPEQVAVLHLSAR